MQTRSRARGFTYLWLMFAIAMAGATAAAMGQRWATIAQRDREAELVFRGAQIAAAIASYRATSPVPAWPHSLEELVEDRRGTRVRHHLRRLYADPLTGRPDWVLIEGEDGGIRGVRSRSALPAFRTAGLRPQRAGMPVRVSDHVFMAPEGVTRAAAMASSPAASAEGIE